MQKTKTTAPFTISNRFLRLIAHHIFGDSPVTVMRELVQNAHDAVLMRAAQEVAPPDGWGVTVDINEAERQITILDTGVGMGPDDIVNSLTRLGAGAKEEHKIEELRKKVRNPEMLKNVAGLFGFGFVAAMMVSRKVEIWTRRAGEPPIFCCFAEGEEAGFYEERNDPAQVPAQGTRVVLHIDAERARIQDDLGTAARGGTLLNEETLTKILQKYCDLMEFEIALTVKGGRRSVANLRQAPWERMPHPSGKEMFAYFQRRFGERLNEPLDYIVFKFTRETNNIEAAGVLYIPNPSALSDKEEGRLELFVKRLWLCDDDLECLPEWAQFLKGVIVSPDLAVAIDRRRLDKLDRGYHDLRVALRDHLRAYLVELASKRRETFQAFMDTHGERFRRGLLAERSRFEGSRPIWFTDLARTVPFRVYAKRYPGGYLASINDLLNVDSMVPLLLAADGERHLLHGVNRVIPQNQQSEFRRVIADKSFPIIVPETDLDLYYLNVIGHDFEDVLRIEDVEFRFGEHFVQPIPVAEQDRWQPFIDFLRNLLRYEDKEAAGAVNAGGIPTTELPILIHWKERGDGKATEEPPQRRDPLRQITTINTSNPLMQDLLKHLEDLGLHRIDYNSMVGNCLHASYHLALLEQYANLAAAVFQDIVHEACELMKRGLIADRELDALKTARDQLQSDLIKKTEEIEQLKATPKDGIGEPRIRVPKEPERRTAAIVYVDLVGSTEALVALDFADRASVFDTYVQVLKTEVENQGGFFDKFTGDGVLALFGVDNANVPPEDACARAERFCNRAIMLTQEFGDRSDVRSKIPELAPGRSGSGVFACRVAVAYGPIAFGQFGGTGSAVGTRMVEAARICSDKELYADQVGGLVITGDVYRTLGGPRFYRLLHEKYQARGLARMIEIYRRS
jgi:HSP90 family molecular chaperone/class 3 adenylate cyclase